MLIKSLLLLFAFTSEMAGVYSLKASRIEGRRLKRPGKQEAAVADYCGDNFHHCHGDATCISTSSSFLCKCKRGYTGDGLTEDIDECVSSRHDCHINAKCTNTIGGYSCQCAPGYSGDGTECEDLDECALNTHDCQGDLAECVNEMGGFRCQCSPGYQWRGASCRDFNECTSANQVCHSDATCYNTRGSYICRCNRGFRGNGISCTDRDECELRIHTCDKLHAWECVNTHGGFSCQCASGYVAVGETCLDLDECTNATQNTCDPNASCLNIPGGFECECNSGYVGDGRICADIDECRDRSDFCSIEAWCTNKPGGFTCQCAAGLTGDGYDCIEIPACSKGWKMVFGGCYKYVPVKRRWHDARQDCVSQGGDLISVHSMKEVDAVRAFADQYRGGKMSWYWIGLTDEEDERGTAKDGWVWSDGSGVTTEEFNMFTEVGPREYIQGDQDCIFAFGPYMNWFSARCTSKLEYICEKHI